LRASRSSSPKTAHAEWIWLGHRERGCAVDPIVYARKCGRDFHELRLSPLLQSSCPGSCMQGPASFAVILSSNLIAPSRTARCCALHKDLDPRWMLPGRYRHHSDTTESALRCDVLRPRLLTPLGAAGTAQGPSSRGTRNAIFALHEPVLEVPGRGVREPNVVVERPEERYAGADQDRNPGDG